MLMLLIIDFLTNEVNGHYPSFFLRINKYWSVNSGKEEIPFVTAHLPLFLILAVPMGGSNNTE